MPQVLIIEDEPLLAENIRESLRLAGHDVICAASGEAGLAAAQEKRPDVILLDVRLPGIDGMEVLQRLRETGHDASIVIMTAYGNVRSAVEAMRGGASDYLTKPLDLHELDLVIDRVLSHRRITSNLEYFRRRERTDSTLDQIIGKSEAIAAVRRFVERLTSSPALASDVPPTVLLTGETGTGKDLVARVIHYAGPRQNQPFIHVNCTALPDHLVEAELFGYAKGAFTDAREDKRGLMELADRGTVFLDEVGHMKPALQAKLLGVLEQRTVRPVGSTRERKVNIHVIAATNRELKQAIEAGEFREDLYHRLRVLSCHLPPLHRRPEDISQLATHFLRFYAGRFKLPQEGFSDEAMSALRGYEWPGNVRELAHVVESALLMADGPQVRPEHLSIRPTEASGKLHVQLASDRTLTLDFTGRGPTLEEIEYQIIQAAVEFAKHNVSRAARILGLSRDAVRYRLEKQRSEAREVKRDFKEGKAHD